MTTNARLLAFFEARLDEEETAANAATKGPWLIDEGDETPDHSLTIKGGPDQIPDVPGRETVVYSPHIWDETRPDFAHIARHDPTRVLAEIRIKRYLISEYRSVEGFDERSAVEAAMRLPDEILAYLTGDEIYTHQIPAAIDATHLGVLSQHPQLVGVTPVTNADLDDVGTWLTAQEQRFGSSLPLAPVPGWGAHDPIQELVDRFGPDRVIPVVIADGAP